MISQSIIQKINDSVKILDVVGDFVVLKNRGANYIGLCPFHNEKSPSFTVSPAKNIYKCFGCGKAGSAIGFLMESESLTYFEALKWLVDKFNIDVELNQTDEDLQKISEAEQLTKIYKIATEYYNNALLQTVSGKQTGLNYLQNEREIPLDTIGKFELGVCLQNDSNELFEKLVAENIEPSLISQSGIFKINDAGKAKEIYTDRIIFPIKNATGKNIGFGARALKNSQQPKYINSPDNALFNKSKSLYGIHLAKRPIQEIKSCILVEGYLDVISLQKHLIFNVVASCGTSITADQLRLLKRYTNHIIIFFDGDEAGTTASFKTLELCLELGFNVEKVFLPEKEDPDSISKKFDTEQFKSFYEQNKKDFISSLIENLAQYQNSDILSFNENLKKLISVLSKISHQDNSILLELYLKKLVSSYNLDIENLKKQILFNRKTKSSSLNFPADELANEIEVDPFSEEKNILQILISYGNLKFEETTIQDYVFRELEFFPFEDEFYNSVYNLCFDNFYEGNPLYRDYFEFNKDEKIRAILVSSDNSEMLLSPNWEKFSPSLTTDEEIVRSLKKNVVAFKIKKLNKELRNLSREIELEKDFQSKNEKQILFLELNKEKVKLNKILGGKSIRSIIDGIIA